MPRWATIYEKIGATYGEDILVGAIFAMIPSLTTCPAGTWDDLYAASR